MALWLSILSVLSYEKHTFLRNRNTSASRNNTACLHFPGSGRGWKPRGPDREQAQSLCYRESPISISQLPSPAKPPGARRASHGAICPPEPIWPWLLSNVWPTCHLLLKIGLDELAEF